MNFNKRVAAEALRADGYTQQEVAEVLGVSQRTISIGRKILINHNKVGFIKILLIY